MSETYDECMKNVQSAEVVVVVVGFFSLLSCRMKETVNKLLRGQRK